MRTLALLLLSIFSLSSMYILESINRPDVWNIRWCVWPLTLILVISTAISQRAGSISHGQGPASGALSTALLVAISCMCISPYAFPGTLQTIFGGLSGNMRMLSKPVPSDRVLVGPERSRVAGLIAAQGGCTFAANDDAIIYLVSRVPSCSRFSLGDYIAPSAQGSVIEELKASPLQVVPFDGDEWWSNVDGRNFQARAPLVASWILKHYPVKTVVGKELLLTKAPIPAFLQVRREQK